MSRLKRDQAVRIYVEMTPRERGVLCAEVMRRCRRPNGGWQGPTNIEEVVLRALAMCSSEPIESAEFQQQLPRAIFTTFIDEQRVGDPMKMCRKMKRHDEAVLNTREGQNLSPEEIVLGKESLEHLDKDIATLPTKYQAPVRWWVADNLGMEAPSYQALGIPSSTWYSRLEAGKVLLLEIVKERLARERV